MNSDLLIDSLKSIPHKPGVYRFYATDGGILYVGKAKDLQKRVSSYFRDSVKDGKTKALRRKIASIDITVTANELEALLLESNLIKKFKPYYNILFKDDKSYPYLLLSKHDFPRLFIYRGNKKRNADYFGPFPSAYSLRDTLNFLYKTFLIRSCNDNFFTHRSRPCLQYQIGRCSAPCVGYISSSDYAEKINLLKKFLRGDSKEVIRNLQAQMEQAAINEEFELAAKLRDQITRLRQLLTPQRIERSSGNFDVIVVVEKRQSVLLELLNVRYGSLIGSKVYFPRLTRSKMVDSNEEILRAFLVQYYLGSDGGQSNLDIPEKIVLNYKISGLEKIAQAISEVNGKKIKLLAAPRGKMVTWIKMAEENGFEALKRRFKEQDVMQAKFADLQELLQLDILECVECFDVSHIAGDFTVASCVVFTPCGANKKEYRIFNIKTAGKSDDYAAMAEVLSRRYQGILDRKENLPDVVLIDGGRGQLKVAAEVLTNLGIIDKVKLLAIAKGEGRKPGLETIYNYLPAKRSRVILDVSNFKQAFLLLQQIRDAAHRFAISKQRYKARKNIVENNVVVE